MFGNLGFSEMLVIFLIALVVFGPRRLPDIARTLGRALGQFRRAANDLRNTVEREVQADELRKSVDEVRSLASQASAEGGALRREIDPAPAPAPAPTPRPEPEAVEASPAASPDPSALTDETVE